MQMAPEGRKPVLGVLGGMGPGATNDFLGRLARLTPAERDQDHVPTLVYSDTTTPDRSDAMLGLGSSPLPAMLRGIEFLNKAGCALIAMPCNSAHYWYDELAAGSDVPVLHIVDSTAAELERRGVRTVGLMATDGTCKSGIYQARLDQYGITVLDLTHFGDSNSVMRGIRAYKAGNHTNARELLRNGGQELIKRGADALVFGCTDISAALPDITAVDEVPVIDASECLAKACLDHLG